MRRNLLVLIFIGACTPKPQKAVIAIPSSVEVQKSVLEDLQHGVIRGEYIRYTGDGIRSVYMKGDVTSITSTSISALTVATKQHVVFYSRVPVSDPACNSICLEMTRVIKASMPGAMPMFPSDFMPMTSRFDERSRKDLK